MDTLGTIINLMKESTKKDSKSFRQALKESKDVKETKLSDKQAEIKDNRLQKVTEALQAKKQKKTVVNENATTKNKIEALKKNFNMKEEKKNERLESILKKAEQTRAEKKACEGDKCKDGEECDKKECGDKAQRREEAHKAIMQRVRERREAMSKKCDRKEGGKCRVGNLRRKENRCEEEEKECDRRADIKRAENRREAIRRAHERAEARRRMEQIKARREAMKESMERRDEARRDLVKRQMKHESLVRRIRNARKSR